METWILALNHPTAAAVGHGVTTIAAELLGLGWHRGTLELNLLSANQEGPLLTQSHLSMTRPNKRPSFSNYKEK